MKKYSGTSLLWDTSIQGTQTLVPEKHPYNLVAVTCIKGTPPFREKGHIFWVPKPKFNLHAEDTLALKT